MGQLIGGLIIIAILVYFVFFNGGSNTQPIDTPLAYQQQIDKAKNVQNIIDQQAAEQRQHIEQESQ